jgi:hypothetical protein
VDVEFFVVKEKGRELLLGACLERRNWRERGERSVETHHFARQCAWKRNALSSLHLQLISTISVFLRRHRSNTSTYPYRTVGPILVPPPASGPYRYAKKKWSPLYGMHLLDSATLYPIANHTSSIFSLLELDYSTTM